LGGGDVGRRGVASTSSRGPEVALVERGQRPREVGSGCAAGSQLVDVIPERVDAGQRRVDQPCRNRRAEGRMPLQGVLEGVHEAGCTIQSQGSRRALETMAGRQEPGRRLHIGGREKRFGKLLQSAPRLVDVDGQVLFGNGFLVADGVRGGKGGLAVVGRALLRGGRSGGRLRRGQGGSQGFQRLIDGPAEEQTVSVAWFFAQLHPDDLPATREALRTAHASEAGAYDMQYRMRAADGSYRWIRSLGKVAARDPAG